MARHKVVTTDVEIDLALEQAKQLQGEPRVTAIEYRSNPQLDLLILKFSDATRRVIPRENIEELRNATARQIAHVEIVGNGAGLHWSELDLDLYVPSLLRDIYGTRRWMAQLGRVGGMVKSPEKRRAAQANGRKGGRPTIKKLVVQAPHGAL